MVEIDNPLKRSEVLSKMGGFEETFSIKIGDKLLKEKQSLMLIEQLQMAKHHQFNLYILILTKKILKISKMIM